MSYFGYTRSFIVERACDMASEVGLTGLSFGNLAAILNRAKSTVYFHFPSMEALQLGVLNNAARELMRMVIRPAFLVPDGLPRLDQLFSHWLEWDGRVGYPGGCLFVACATEFDDRPGPVRDALVRLWRDWLSLLDARVRHAIAQGALHPGTDRAQFLHDLQGIMLAYHHARRLLKDPGAERRARHAYAMLVEQARNEV